MTLLGDKKKGSKYKKAERRKVQAAIREIVQSGVNDGDGIAAELNKRGVKSPDGGPATVTLVHGQLAQMRSKGFRPLKRFSRFSGEPERAAAPAKQSLHRLPTSLVLMMEDGDLTAAQKLRIVKAYLSEVE